MAESLPIVLVPGLNCSPRLYAAQMSELWRFGPVTVADHTRDDTMAAIARRILGSAPPRFALAGLSMGGYIALEIIRQAADRVAKLALLDTGSRADTPEARARPVTAQTSSARSRVTRFAGPRAGRARRRDCARATKSSASRAKRRAASRISIARSGLSALPVRRFRLISSMAARRSASMSNRSTGWTI